MNQKFKNFEPYKAESFRELQNVTYKAQEVGSSHIVFDCRSPGGSVLLTDPVLETRWELSLMCPRVNRQDGTISYQEETPDAYDKVVVCGGAVPVQGVCDSVVHRMGSIVICDTEVYKTVEPWTSLNYNGPV